MGRSGGLWAPLGNQPDSGAKLKHSGSKKKHKKASRTISSAEDDRVAGVGKVAAHGTIGVDEQQKEERTDSGHEPVAGNTAAGGGGRWVLQT